MRWLETDLAENPESREGGARVSFQFPLPPDTVLSILHVAHFLEIDPLVDTACAMLAENVWVVPHLTDLPVDILARVVARLPLAEAARLFATNPAVHEQVGAAYWARARASLHAVPFAEGTSAARWTDELAFAPDAVAALLAVCTPHVPVSDETAAPCWDQACLDAFAQRELDLLPATAPAGPARVAALRTLRPLLRMVAVHTARPPVDTRLLRAMPRLEVLDLSGHVFRSPDALTAVARAAARVPVLVLARCALASLAPLAPLFGRDSCVRALDLSDNHLDANELVQHVRGGAPALRALFLRNNPVTTVGLAFVLRRLPRVRYLDAGRCRVASLSFEELLPTTTTTTTTTTTVGDRGEETDGDDETASGGGGGELLPEIRSLVLSDNPLGFRYSDQWRPLTGEDEADMRSMRSFARFLARSQLRTLVLRNCMIRSAHLRVLLDALPVPLAHLSLADNDIDADGWAALAAHLARPRCALVSLDLTGSPLLEPADLGGIALALARGTAPLETLVLAVCGLGDAHLVQLRPLRMAATLRMLALESNACSARELAALAEDLRPAVVVRSEGQVLHPRMWNVRAADSRF